MRKKRGLNESIFNSKIFKTKKGLSDVLATLLIILLVIVATGVVWVVIRNVILTGAEDIAGTRFFNLNIVSAYKDKQSSLDVVRVSVRRDTGEGDLTGIRFVFFDGRDSYTVDRMTPLGVLGQRTFTFNGTEIGAGVLTLIRVSIAPIYEVSGRQRVGNILDTEEIGDNPPGGGGGGGGGGGSGDSFLLSISRQGSGSGGVISAPTGINCGSDCSEEYLDGTQVTLSASASSGSTFTGWGGDGCTGTGNCVITIDSDKQIVAVFDIQTPGSNTLTVTKSGTGSGTVQSTPSGINCGNDCSETYTGSDSLITLTASASSGSVFIGWSGACSGTGSCVVTIDSNKIVNAQFDLIPGSAVCGNEIVESGEECDGTNLNGRSCIALGYIGGTLTCNPPGGDNECTFNTAQCIEETPPSCNGTWLPPEDPGVECDGGLNCRPDCTCPVGFSPDTFGGCTLNPPVNSGTIFSVWLSGAPIFFDSENLPKNQVDLAPYTSYYVNFSSSPETRCFRITFAAYVTEINRSYLRLNSIANINSGQGYRVWEAANCGEQIPS